jgi:hypothetical protein
MAGQRHGRQLQRTALFRSHLRLRGAGNAERRDREAEKQNRTKNARGVDSKSAVRQGRSFPKQV